MNVHMRNPGELIGSLPGLLGFTPHASLIVVALDGNTEIICLLRVDFDDALADDACMRQMAESVDGVGAASVFVVWVADSDEADPQFVAGTATLAGLLSAQVKDTYFTDLVSWRDTDGRSGVAAKNTAVNCAAVAQGRLVDRTRDELEATLAAGDTMSVTEVECSDDRSAVLGRALLDAGVRDLFCGEAVGGNAAKVEADLLAAARVLPGEYRAQALSMVAFFAYCRGDGALAGIAIDECVAAGGTQLAQLLDSALRAGFHPSVIREMATAGMKV